MQNKDILETQKLDELHRELARKIDDLIVDAFGEDACYILVALTDDNDSMAVSINSNVDCEAHEEMLQVGLEAVRQSY